MANNNGWGGRRKGSGAKTFFPGKRRWASAMSLTDTGHKMLDRTVKRLTREYQSLTGNPRARVSRNEVLEALSRLHAEHLTLRHIERASEEL